MSDPRETARARAHCEEMVRQAQQEAIMEVALHGSIMALGIAIASEPAGIPIIGHLIELLHGADLLATSPELRPESPAMQHCEEVLRRHAPEIEHERNQARTHGRPPLVPMSLHRDHQAVVDKVARLKNEAKAAHDRWAAAYKAETGQTLLHAFVDPMPESRSKSLADAVSASLQRGFRRG